MNALGYTFDTAQLCNALLATQAVQHNADLLFSAILLVGFTFDVFDDALAMRCFILSHHSLVIFAWLYASS